MSDPKQGIAPGGATRGSCVANIGQAMDEQQEQKTVARLQILGNTE